MTRAEAARRQIQEAVKRPASRLLALWSDDAITATASPRHDAGGDGPSKSVRVSIRTVAVRVDGDKVPVDAEESRDDRGPADRVEDRRVGALARRPAVAGQLGDPADPGCRPRRQCRGDGNGADHHSVLD